MRRTAFVGALMSGVWAIALVSAAPAEAQLPLRTTHTFLGRTGPRVPLANAPIEDSSGAIYGLTWEGGSTGLGTAFRWRAEDGFTALHAFSETDGAPVALTFGIDGHLYGLTTLQFSRLRLFRLTMSGDWTPLGVAFPLLSKFGIGGRSSIDGGHLHALSDGSFAYFGLDRAVRIDHDGAGWTVFADGLLRRVYADTRGRDGALYLIGTGFVSGGSSPDAHLLRWDPVANVFTDIFAFPRGSMNGSPAWLTQATDGHFYAADFTYSGAGDTWRAWRVTMAGTGAVIHRFEGGILQGWVAGSDGHLYGATRRDLFSTGGAIIRMSNDGVVTTLHSGAMDGGGPLSLGLLRSGDLIGTFGEPFPFWFARETPGGLFRVVSSGVPAVGLVRFTFGADGYNPVALLKTAFGRVGVTESGTPLDQGLLFEVDDAGRVIALGGPSSTDTQVQHLGRHVVAVSDGATCPDGCYVGTYLDRVSGMFSVYRWIRPSASSPARFEVVRAFQSSEGRISALAPAAGGAVYIAHDAVRSGTWFGQLSGLTEAGELVPLHYFLADEGFPNSLLRASDGTLYGTAFGGRDAAGAVFRFSTGGVFSLISRFTEAVGRPGNLMHARDGSLWGTLENGEATLFQLLPSGERRIFGGPRLTSLVEADSGDLYGPCDAPTGRAVCRVTPQGVVTVVLATPGPVKALIADGNRLVAATEPAFPHGGRIVTIALTPERPSVNLRHTLTALRRTDGSLRIAGRAPLTGAGAPGDVAVPGDFDGDGTLDVAFFQPSTGVWTIPGAGITRFGTAGDIPVPGDYDGDGRTELAVFRPSSATWFVAGRDPVVFGSVGDLPVPGDYSGTGRTQFAVYRRGVWYVDGSAPVTWGAPSDVPVPADYDHNGTIDFAVYRRASGQWFVRGQFEETWGAPGDIPAPQDVNGDGRVELVVFRRAAGEWLMLDRTNQTRETVTMGGPGDVPLFAPRLPMVTGDVDGDARADLAVARRSAATIFVAASATGRAQATTWGATTDSRLLGDYDGDGLLDVAAYRPATGEWFVRTASGAVLRFATGTPDPRDRPLVGDFDGDGRADPAVFGYQTAVWRTRRSTDGQLSSLHFGAARGLDVPVPADYDGDGLTDQALWRRATGEWFIRRSSDARVAYSSGDGPGATDRVAPADYDGDGRVDPAVVHRDGRWWLSLSSSAVGRRVVWGNPSVGDVPVPLDYDGDGRADVMIHRATSGAWHSIPSSTGGSRTTSFGSATLGDSAVWAIAP